jgi:hypothetical protein
MDEGCGPDLNQLVHVIGRHDADRSDTADLAGVATHLGGIAHADPDELERRVTHYLRNNHLPDESSAPHCDLGRRPTLECDMNAIDAFPLE